MPSPSGVDLHLLEQIGEGLRMQLIDLDHLFDLLRIVLVVRHGVVAVGDADRAIASVAAFARDHATDHARHIGLIRDHHQVHHQSRVIFELLGDAAGRSMTGNVTVAFCSSAF